MKTLLFVFFLFLSAAPAQLIEDFSCLTPVAITNTSPAVVTCPSPHHFNQRAYAFLTLNSPVQDDIATMDGVVYRFVTTLNNSIPNQVLIGNASADSAANLGHAVNDDGVGKGTLYSSATIAHPTLQASTNYTAAQVELYYRLFGPSGIGVAVSSTNTTRMAWDQPALRMDWNVGIRGATGNWTSIGTNGVPKHMIARYVSPTQFSLWLTVAAPYSAASNGSFTGQQLQLTHETLAQLPFPNNTRAESWGNYSYYTADPFFAVTIPACTDPTHELECSMAYRNLDSSSKYAGKKQTISSFVISSQVATITFASVFPFVAADGRNLKAGSLLWVRNIQDTPGSWTHTSTYANDSSGTVQNHLVKFIQGTNSVGPISRESGGAIGVCISGCGTSGAATIADGGLVTCFFSNPTVAGHWVTLTGADDTCVDSGSSSYPFTNFQFGVVQDTGAAGLHRVWINGINRAFTVQSVNGPGDGTNVTQVTIKTPGYADGTYAYSALPGYSGSPWGSVTAFAGTNFTGNPYVYYLGGSTSGPYRHVSGLLQRNLRDASAVDYSKPIRISAWIKYGKNLSSCGAQVGSQMGNFTMPPGFPPTNNSNHYYHYLDHPGYAGQWSLITLNSTPTHQEGHIDGTNANYPADVGWVGGPFNWSGAEHYWESVENYYYDVHGISCNMGGPTPMDSTGQTLYYSPVVIGNDTSGEPEELVTSRGGVWTPHLFQSTDTPYTPTGTPGYDLYWAGPKGIVVQYEVRYSTVGSLKQIGFSNGLCKNGTTTCSAADRTSTPGDQNSTYYQSGPLNQQSNIWWGVKPISVPVLGTTGAGANPSWVITLIDTGIQAGDRATVTGVNSFASQTNVTVSATRPYQTWMRFDPVPNRNAVIFTYVANPGGPIKISLPGHGYLTGQTVQLDRGLPFASYDGRYTVTVIDGSTFTLDGSSYDASCPCAGGGIRLNTPDKLINIVSDGSTCTANLTVNHNIFPGWRIAVWGSTNATLTPNAAISGDDPKLYTVSATPTPQSFTFTCTGVPAGVYDKDSPGGSRFGVQSLPGVAFPVTGTATYTTGGAIFSNEDKRGFAEIQLYPYTPPTLLSQRFGGVVTSTAAIFLYATPDSSTCTLAVNGSGTGTGSVMDGGGERSRSRVWTGLAQNTTYQFSLICGAYFATGNFTTPASLLTATSGSVQIAATPPAVAAAADNLVVDYGNSATVLDQSANVACSVGSRCSTSFTRSLDSVVWVRRRWCMNRSADPTCSIASNEVARSTPEAITVR